MMDQLLLRPFGFCKSLLLFGVPGCMFFASYHWLMPWLVGQGMSIWWAYLLQSGLALTSMLVAALIAYRLEGNAWTWEALKARFRLHSINGKTWVLMGVVFAIEVGLNALIANVEMGWIEQGWFNVPDWLPDFLHPLRGMMALEAIDQAVGGLDGKWAVPAAMLAVLFVNVFGEEIWWRGFILPRNELAFGKWTWVIHGLFWNFFHFFKWWGLVSLLPMSLGLSYVAYKSKNTTTGIVIHTITNGIGIFSIVLAVLG